MQWDYNRDGKRENVQFWADIDIESDGKDVKGHMLKSVPTHELIRES
jgi:hypothetical protein